MNYMSLSSCLCVECAILIYIYVSAVGVCRPENSTIQRLSIIITVIFDAIECNFSMPLRTFICHPAHFWPLMPDQKKMQYGTINYQNWCDKLSILLLLLFFIINIILLVISWLLLLSLHLTRDLGPCFPGWIRCFPTPFLVTISWFEPTPSTLCTWPAPWWCEAAWSSLTFDETSTGRGFHSGSGWVGQHYFLLYWYELCV